MALQSAPLTFFVNRVEGEILNFKEFSPDLKPSPKTSRIWDMTWETYCREEAAECERLARDVQGDDRKIWAQAARQWRSQLAKRKPADGENGRA